MTVVNQGIDIGKSLRRNQLFGIQSSVGLAEYNVPFAWNPAESIIMRH
jgi:hypothetical protein